MLEKILQHKTLALKVLLSMIAVVLLTVAFITFDNSQRLADRQALQSQQSVANHTQTLNEIKQAVEELKANNAADHQQTVQYINCVLVGVTDSSSQSQALSVYKTCLINAGITTNVGNN